MSGMDRLTDEALERVIGMAQRYLAYFPCYKSTQSTEDIAMARELLAHRRASQPAPAPVFEDDAAEKAKLNCYCDRLDPVEAPAPSDGLREALGTLLVQANGVEPRDAMLRQNVIRIADAALTPAPAQEGDE